jgi:hypothetical protein
MEYYEGNSSEAAIQLFLTVVVLGFVATFLMMLFSGDLKRMMKFEWKLHRDVREAKREINRHKEKSTRTRSQNENCSNSKNGF